MSGKRATLETDSLPLPNQASAHAAAPGKTPGKRPADGKAAAKGKAPAKKAKPSVAPTAKPPAAAKAPAAAQAPAPAAAAAPTPDEAGPSGASPAAPTPAVQPEEAGPSGAQGTGDVAATAAVAAPPPPAADPHICLRVGNRVEVQLVEKGLKGCWNLAVIKALNMDKRTATIECVTLPTGLMSSCTDALA